MKTNELDSDLRHYLKAARLFLERQSRGVQHERNRDPETWLWWNERIRIMARGYLIERARTAKLRKTLILYEAHAPAEVVDRVEMLMEGE